jgi:hypothetical protein
MDHAALGQGDADQAAAEATGDPVLVAVEAHRELGEELIALADDHEAAVGPGEVEHAAQEDLGRGDVILLGEEQLRDFDPRVAHFPGA